LITGGTGFIGSRLALACREAGSEVVALGQTNTDIEVFRKEQLRVAGIDVRAIPVDDTGGLAAAVTGCNVIYHLAAAQHESNVPDRYFRDINVEGTRNVLSASRDAGVSRFVHGSTIGVYGSAAAGRIDESTGTRPDNIYGITKLEGEDVARQFGSEIEISIIRISETYGPGDGRLLKLFKAIEKGAFFVIGKGTNLHQLIHVDDLVRGLMAAAMRPAAVNETILLAGSEQLTTIEMCKCIADAMGVSLSRLRAPLWPFDVVATVLESVCRPLGVQPPLHRRRLDFFRKSFLLDTTKATRLLDFEASKKFRAGAVETATWYRAQGLL
jgi:nucleoside-diphosphate-sugar epimerase